MTKFWAISLLIILFFTIAYSLLVLNWYGQFRYPFTDNVYFDTALWKVSQLQEPIVRHSLLGEINILGDHFHPTIFLYSLLYMLSPRQEIILLGMVVVYSLSAGLGALVGFKLLKNKLLVLSLLIAYFLYIGTQNAFIYGFHEVNLMPLFFMLVFYALVNKKTKLYWLSLALLLLTKESLAFVSVGIGIATLFLIKDMRKTAILTIVVSLAYFFIVTRAVIPHFSGRYLHGEIGLPTDFSDLRTKLETGKEIWKTYTVSLASFGLLPLLNIGFLFLLAQDFLTRYLLAQPGTSPFSLSYHYNLVLAPIMFVSSLWTLKSLEKYKLFAKLSPFIAVGLILISIAFTRFTNPRGPILSVFNPAFYQTTAQNAFLWQLIAKTPRDGKIMAQNHLGYLFAHSDVFPMETMCDTFGKISPKYIVADLRKEQFPDNFFPLTHERTIAFFTFLEKSGGYRKLFTKNQMVILKETGKVNYATKKDCPRI